MKREWSLLFELILQSQDLLLRGLSLLDLPPLLLGQLPPSLLILHQLVDLPEFLLEGFQMLCWVQRTAGSGRGGGGGGGGTGGGGCDCGRGG